MLKGSQAIKRFDSIRFEPLDERPDTTILTLDDPLTAEQQRYLKDHKTDKRTELAKAMGITKTRLNHQLQRLGG